MHMIQLFFYFNYVCPLMLANLILSIDKVYINGTIILAMLSQIRFRDSVILQHSTISNESYVHGKLTFLYLINNIFLGHIFQLYNIITKPLLTNATFY